MFEGEIIFYNGFNLLVDILVGVTVWFFTRRSADANGYGEGVYDVLSALDAGELQSEMDEQGNTVWLLPCDNGAVIRIPMPAPTQTSPNLFVVPEAD